MSLLGGVLSFDNEILKRIVVWIYFCSIYKIKKPLYHTADAIEICKTNH